ncbi:xylulokinase [Massiliimalia massiliensis]|uniref:xylulokinase n=1 Tax=Massiliimalia massiliensis TaxID=1852384 RepID=UPI0009872095|nr:FGGY-family carbohydrate kinase [Massiliimalia massiliensis]
MEKQNIAAAIRNGEVYLGIEMGSTRIKAVLIGPDHSPIASGAFDWENRFENGVWTYHLEDVWTGIRAAYRGMAEDVKGKYGEELTRLGALGISAMMHGYLPFDAQGKQIASFRTWRNTTTEQAAVKLTELFQFNIPLRWSIAHLYQAILNGEEHVKDISYLTTLAGYVHWALTGEKVMGVGEASGMFPIDSNAGTFDAGMTAQFDEILREKGFSFTLSDIMPRVLTAGEAAGQLTEEGARRLDPTGALQAGVPLCPPEGDAGTGMVATNSVAPRTGNVSAGTSVFAMVVLEKALSRVYPEIDMVTTPAGAPVAMAHCNTCTSDLDAWVRVFGEMAKEAGAELSKPALYDLLYYKALEGDADCGGVLTYNYYSGEPITGVTEGRPMVVRMPDAKLTLANFMRAQLYATMATLKIGMDILFDQENVKLDQLLGHGGLFKTPGVGQRFMAAAIGVPVAVMETAGEGGPWGMALLAAFQAKKQEGETLETYLANHVFAQAKGSSVEPDEKDQKGFSDYLVRYKAGLAAQQAAVDVLK